MPHERPRLLLPILLKRLKLWPIVGVVGVRQSGKSVLLKRLLMPNIQGKYTSLDSATERSRANSSPEAFSEPQGRWTQIIDEIQKSPGLFDALKLHVDESRRPGMYVISRSTEFSKLTGIREALTGRIGVLRLYPMTLSELFQKTLGAYWTEESKSKLSSAELTLEEFDNKLNRGGMPGLCFIRDDLEFNASCEVWLETTCFRDLQQVQPLSIEGGLALELLGHIAVQAEPTLASLSRALRKDSRVVAKVLEALQAILVIQRLDPHSAGVGKSIYVLCDVGIASFLGGGRENLIRTHLLYEALAHFESKGFGRPRTTYYRNEKTSRVPLIFDWQNRKGAPASMAIQYQDSEALGSRDLSSLLAFSKRASWKGRLMILTQTKNSYREGEIEVLPLRG